MSDARKVFESEENDSGENFSRKEESVLDLTCSICLEQMKKETRASIACAHQFCYPCIEEWAKVENSCPICKAPFYHFSSKAVSRTVTKKIQPVVDNIEYEDDSESSSSHYIDDEAMEASNDETSEEGILQNREGMELYGNLFCESETFGIYPYADDASESTTSDAYDTNSTYGEEDSDDEGFVTDEEYSATSSDEGIHDEIERKEKHRKRKNKKRKERMEKKERRKDAQLDQDLEALLQDDMNQLSSKSQLTNDKISLSDTSSDTDEAENRTIGEVKRVRNDGSTQEKSEQIELVDDIEEVIGETEERLSQIFIDSEEDGSILDEYESDSFIVSDGDEISLLEASEENEVEWSASESSEESERERRRKKRKDEKKMRKKASKSAKASPPSAEPQPKRNRKALLEDSESSEDDKKRKRLKRKKEGTDAKSNGIQIDLISPHHESKSAKRKVKQQSIAISLSSESDESSDGSISSENSSSPSGGDMDKENIGRVNATRNNNNSTEGEVSYKRAYSNNRLFSPVQQSEVVSKPKNEKFKQAMRKKREDDSAKDSDDSFNSSILHCSISDYGMLEDDSENNSKTPLKRGSCQGPASSRFTSINLETGEVTTSSYCVEKMDVSENGSHLGNDASFSSQSPKDHHSPNRSKLFSRFNRSGFVSFVKGIERDQGVDLCSPKRAEEAEKERRREKWHRRGAQGVDKGRNGCLGHRSVDDSGKVDENRLESFEINFDKFLMNSQETK